MFFRYAHSSHDDWRQATENVLAQLDAQRQNGHYSSGGNLGVLYLTEALTPQLEEILSALKMRTGVANWVGSVGTGIIANCAQYHAEPALVAMLLDLPPESFQVFSGRQRPPSIHSRNQQGAWLAQHAIVHADPTLPDLPDLIQDMASKTRGRSVSGGLTSARTNPYQIANEVLQSGISGVMLSSEVSVLTRITQGCQPLGKAHSITNSEGYLIYTLDGQPALDVLLSDLGARPGGLIADQYMRRLSNGLFAAVAEADSDAEIDYQVRNLVALDPNKRSIAIADRVIDQQQLLFCMRDADAARKDLQRICREIRELLDTDPQSPRIRGALYYTCIGRDQKMFDNEQTEMRILIEELGDIPLIGFCANGEIAGDRLYGYSGVLSVFY